MLNFKNKTMKKLLLLTKTLLAAALLCVGQNAWAVDYPYNVGSSTSDGYGAAFSPEYSLTGDGQVDITFTNYRKTEGNYWENWILMCANSDEVTPTTNLTNKVFTVRSDWYDDKAESNASFTTGGGYTNSDFCTFQNDATVNIRITRIGETVSVFTTVTKSADTRWMSYYKTGVTAGTLKFYLTQNLSYLTITDEPTVTTNEAQSVLFRDYEEDSADPTTGWACNGKNNYSHQIQLGTSGNNHFCQLFGNINAQRSAHWTYGIASSLTADNWVHSFKFNVQQIKGTPSISITGANSSHLNDNSVPTPVYLSLQYDGTTTKYNVVIGTTTLGDQISLTTNAWYSAYLTLLNSDKDQSTINVVIKNSSSEEVLNTTAVVSTSTLGALEGLTCVHLTGGTGNGYIDFDDVSIAKYVAAGTCADPTYEITGTYNSSRKFTLACETPESTIYYSETEKAYGDAGWSEYSSEVTTAATTIYMYAATSTSHSDVKSFATGAGTSIALNGATYSLAYYDLSSSSFYVKVNDNQSSVLGAPSATLAYYTSNPSSTTDCTSGNYISGFAPGSTVYVVASADGYASTTTSYTFPARGAEGLVANWSDDLTSGEALTGGATEKLGNVDCQLITAIGGATLSGNFGVYPDVTTSRWNPTVDGIVGGSYYTGVKNVSDGLGYIKIVVNASTFEDSKISARKNVAFSYAEKNADGSYNLYFIPSGSSCCWNGVSGITIKSVSYLASVSKTISATLGWATYCSPYALDFSSDIANLTGAYLVTGGADGKLTLSDKIEGTIPANTGILLEGSGEVNIPVVASSETNVSSNKLVGVTTETSGVAAGIYVLLYGTDDTSGPVGFYKTANAFTISANTAYLPADFDVVLSAREAYFFDGVTGVKAVDATSKAIVKEGKFIENGKLVIVKNGQKFNAAGAKLY